MTHNLTEQEITQHYNLTGQQWGAFIGDCYTHKSKDRYKLLKKYLDNNYKETEKGLLASDATGMANMIPDLIKYHHKKGLATVIKIAKKSGAQRVKTEVIKTLKSHKEGYSTAHKFLGERKQHLRYIGVVLLIHFNKPEDKELLEELYQNDSNKAITEAIGKYLF